MPTHIPSIQERAQIIRRIVLEQSRRANVGHIASALSIVDLLAVLFCGFVRGAGTTEPSRDRFVLSKGHAALALYVALAERGVIPMEALDTYCADGGLLGVHPEHQLRGIDFSTGSLGQGLSIGAGIVWASRLMRQDTRSFVLMSDAEMNEGSVWEAMMFAGHHRLDHLVVLLDDNGQQALGRTTDVLALEPLEDKWRMFGWHVQVVDGHDHAALESALQVAIHHQGSPSVIVAHTIAGKGVSYMEGQVAWHYLPMSAEQFDDAMRQVGRST